MGEMQMSKPSQDTPKGDDEKRPQTPGEAERGTNAVEHEPDPQAEPIPDGHHKYIRRSPFTAGND